MRLAEFVLNQRIIEHLLFLPAATPPHKGNASASFFHRVAMLRSAIADNSAIAVSLIEAQRHGPSYTVDSLKILHQQYPQDRLVFILGADSLLDLHHWYHFETLFTLADFLVVARNGVDDISCHEAIRSLPGKFLSDEEKKIWSRRDGARIWYLSDFASPFSSTAVRNQLLEGLSPDAVPQNVLAYIHKQGLYSSKEESCTI